MDFDRELLSKVKQAKSAEELFVIAKASGRELTEDEAARYFDELHHEGEIADDELNNVSGGCGDSRPAPRFKADEYVRRKNSEYVWHIVDVHNYTEYGYQYKITRINDTVLDLEYESNLMHR